MTTFLVGLVGLEVNPDSVKAGWIPLLIIIGVAIIIALLGWSMLHEIKKVKVPTRAEVAAAERVQGEASGGDVTTVSAPEQGLSGEVSAEKSAPVDPKA